jgi:hypothetical protein
MLLIFLAKKVYGNGKRIMDISIFGLRLKTFFYPWLPNLLVHMRPTRSKSHFELICFGHGCPKSGKPEIPGKVRE